ncbi:ABC transporter permease [Paenibacillus timonensis]|uniref:ABC transporter permease n=1 Tax=Paenibacillus timonensis TaxID=225915 RepID=UPI003F9DFB0F
MRRSRLAPLLVFCGIALLLSCSGWMSSMLTDWQRTGGQHLLNTLTVNLDKTAAGGLSNANGLTLDEAEALAQEWQPLPAAYEGRLQSAAVFNGRSESCTVIGVSDTYREFGNFPLVSGSMIGPTAATEHSRVTVISSQLADRLFRSAGVEGMQIELFDTTFTIIGVYSEASSLLAQLADDGIPDVMVPITTYMELSLAASIDTIRLSVPPGKTVGATEQATAALTAIGQNPAQFKITSNPIVYKQTAQLNALLLFGCGMLAIFLVIRLLIRQGQSTYRRLQYRLLQDHWPDALKKERVHLLQAAATTLAVLCGFALLWKGIAFRLYIAPDWIPEQLIDVSFYGEKLQQLWQQQTLQEGYQPSMPELLAAAAGKLAGRLFIAGGLLGIPLFLLGIRLWRMEQVPVFTQLQRLAIYGLLAAIISFAGASWAGWDYRIALREYAVPGVFFHAAVFYLNYSKGVKFHETNDHS